MHSLIWNNHTYIIPYKDNNFSIAFSWWTYLPNKDAIAKHNKHHKNINWYHRCIDLKASFSASLGLRDSDNRSSSYGWCDRPFLLHIKRHTSIYMVPIFQARVEHQREDFISESRLDVQFTSTYQLLYKHSNYFSYSWKQNLLVHSSNYMKKLPVTPPPFYSTFVFWPLFSIYRPTLVHQQRLLYTDLEFLNSTARNDLG